MKCASFPGRSSEVGRASASSAQTAGLPWRLGGFLLGVFLVALQAAHPLAALAGENPLEAKRNSIARAKGTNETSHSAWERAVLIGASATAGFTALELLGGTNTQQLRLNRYLDAALALPHQPVRNLGQSLFFTQPETMGPKQVEQALKLQPTLVIGADFLFWFCYGDGATDAERLQRFENGLKMLEPIQCPLVLGDLPDASPAVGLMLTAAQVPGSNGLAAANQRLKSWAASRPNVVILSLSNFMHAALANAPLSLHNQTIPAGRTRALLQFDKLHPSQRGCAALALAIIESLQSARPEQFAGPVRWDPTEVHRLALSPGKADAQEPMQSTGPVGQPATK